MMVEAGARAAGSSEAEIEEAIEYVKLQVRLAKTGQGQDELATATERARHQRWLAHTWNWQELQGPDTDPAMYLRRITCPVLALYGELDTAIGPIGPNKAAIEKGLREGGNRDYTLKVFPQGSHQIWLRESGGLKGYRDLKTYVPGYFDTMTEWLLKRVAVAR
jgi:pimeloyl-ACP methyl ester carboxylesterase